jgi:uncharacterized protein YeaO (DUF488 family)
LKSSNSSRIKLKRAYDESAVDDGRRILVDRIWPRGKTKEELKIDDWLRDIAPSTELRKWFGHESQKWNEFKKRYFSELKDKKELIEKIREHVKHSTVTLVYSAREEQFNNAEALKEYI